MRVNSRSAHRVRPPSTVIQLKRRSLNGSRQDCFGSRRINLRRLLGKLEDPNELTSDPSLPKVEDTAMLLGATGNVGGHVLHLLVQSPLCKKVVVVIRRNVAELANPKVQQAVVNMDKLGRSSRRTRGASTSRSRRSASVRAARRWRTRRCARSRSLTPPPSRLRPRRAALVRRR